MSFILLKEIKGEKEFEVWINLDKVTRIFREKNELSDKCFRICFSSSNDDSVLINDSENHLQNALFKNKAKE
ncbi:hypothetical protein [Xylocopilactobacillus apis]|uniref:Uncharacterized protein n=1 Tax=Xylocopilactobacillus apis TaxID=2932183 RepID=A0AAU9DHG4_9LACO|nr:hypothetical protein [Xylocopilactobacillus apis]BDR56172.1 hypothetical protein KIMC2_07340 [Xylocopilactobacillus apis]